MTAKCKPPPGTPDGAVCWLRSAGGFWEPARWWTEPDGWELMGHSEITPVSYLGGMGWRFHSIATPPAGKEGGE